MRLVLISDTHGLHDQVTVPDGDLLVHAGDLSMSGTVRQLQPALDWLNRQPHRRVVMVAGNHDFAFESALRKSQLDLGRITYLENSSANIDGWIFWGSPVQPWFMDWAFNVTRGAAIMQVWNEIPPDTDVLITHGPPMGILDVTAPQWGSKHVGCEELVKRVEEVQPSVHVFGHIHNGYGQQERHDTRFVNASICDEQYKATNAPIVVDL